jgi:hypothetical protein
LVELCRASSTICKRSQARFSTFRNAARELGMVEPQDRLKDSLQTLAKAMPHPKMAKKQYRANPA